MFMNNLDFRRKSSPSPPITIDESLLVAVPPPLPPPSVPPPPYIGGGRENDWKRLRLHNLPPRMRAGSVTTTTISEPTTPLNDRLPQPPQPSSRASTKQQGKGRAQHLLVKQGGRPSRNLPPRMLPATTTAATTPNVLIRGQRSTPDLRPPPPPLQQIMPPLPTNTLRKKFRPPLPLTLTQLPPPSPSSSCESDAPLQTPSPPPIGLARYNRELGLEFEALQLSDLVGFGIAVSGGAGGGEFTPKPMIPSGNEATNNFFGAIGDRRPLSRSNSSRTTYSTSALGRATSISSHSHSSCSTPTYASHYSYSSSSCGPPPPSPSTAPTSHHSSSLGRSKSSASASSASRYVPNPAFDPFALDSDSEREEGILPEEVGERVVEEEDEEDVDSDGEADDGHGN